MTDKVAKRVAIASCHDKFNFGSALQAYATQISLDCMGVDAFTIDKRSLGKDISKGRNDYYREHFLDFELYHAKLGFVNHRLKQKIDPSFGKKMSERKAAFRRFESSHFRFTPKTRSFDELAELVSDYDTVLAGSDQIWLPVNIAGDYYTLSFVPPCVRKVSYASSFGVSNLSAKYLAKTKEFLSDFAAISVREDTGANIVEEATGKRCQVVCDPTMLLNRQQWSTFADAADIEVPDEPYVFCYFLGNNAWNRDCAVELAKRGLKIVAVAHGDEYIKTDDEYADFYPWGAGPAEWVKLLSHASYVCTDSFHGTVFSNIFHVPFFSFRRHENAGSQSTNSRIDTLLNILGNADRICESAEQFKEALSRDIDFDSVEGRLAVYRAKSEAWLASALEI